MCCDFWVRCYLFPLLFPSIAYARVAFALGVSLDHHLDHLLGGNRLCDLHGHSEATVHQNATVASASPETLVLSYGACRCSKVYWYFFLVNKLTSFVGMAGYFIAVVDFFIGPYLPKPANMTWGFPASGDNSAESHSHALQLNHTGSNVSLLRAVLRCHDARLCGHL